MSLSDRLMARVVEAPSGCLEWTGAVRRDGYGVINAGGHNGATLAVHRVAWELAFGSIPSGLWVLHACDNKRCVNADHLMLGTHTANMIDASRKGRNVMQRDPGPVMDARRRAGYAGNPRGSAHGRAKLTEVAVAEIRMRSAKGEAARALAREFGVSDASIRSAISGTTWATVS